MSDLPDIFADEARTSRKARRMAILEVLLDLPNASKLVALLLDSAESVIIDQQLADEHFQGAYRHQLYDRLAQLQELGIVSVNKLYGGDVEYKRGRIFSDPVDRVGVDLLNALYEPAYEPAVAKLENGERIELAKALVSRYALELDTLKLDEASQRQVRGHIDLLKNEFGIVTVIAEGQVSFRQAE